MPAVACNFCLVPIAEQDGKFCEPLSCGHRYHVSCLQELRDLDVKYDCPCCSVDANQQDKNLVRCAAAIEYLRAVQCTAPGSPARYIVGKRCLELLQRALDFDPNDPKSLCLAGLVHLRGIGVDRDMRTAVRLLAISESAGNATAGLELARIHRQGLGGVARDPSKARALFEKLDRVGNIIGSLELALMVREGEGGDKDLRKACELFEKGAAAGNALGQYELAVIYRDGLCGERNEVLARQLFEQAMEGGYELAAVDLASMYMSGQGGIRDEERGRELYMKIDFGRKQVVVDERDVKEGWVRGGRASRELYADEMQKLRESGEWMQLEETEEQRDPETEKQDSLEAVAAMLGVGFTPAPLAKPKEATLVPKGAEAGGAWRATMGFQDISYGDVVRITPKQVQAADGLRTVVEIGGGVSIIAEYVLPQQLDEFMKRRQKCKERAPKTCCVLC